MRDLCDKFKTRWNSCQNGVKKSKSDIQSDNISSSDFKLVLQQLNILKFEQSKLINLVNQQKRN